MNKLPATWQRLVLSIIGVLVIEGSWRCSVCHLYTLPTAALAGFVSITTNAFYVIGAIIIFMVTGKLVYEWKMGTSQIQSVQSLAENIMQSETTTLRRDPKDYLLTDDTAF